MPSEKVTRNLWVIEKWPMSGDVPIDGGRIDERNYTSGISSMRGLIIVIKGAGEMASGIAHRLHKAGLIRILMTDIEQPLAVRRTVAFCEAVYEGKAEVEGVPAVLLQDVADANHVWEQRQIAVLIDPQGTRATKMRPHVVVDAIMAKTGTSTKAYEAPLVIGVGPGFTARQTVDVVIESNRGHNMGRVIWSGSAEPFSGTPGPTMGYTTERVLRSPHAGTVRHERLIGNQVKEGDVILYVDETPVATRIDGILRGLIRDIAVKEGEKIGDIDPRGRIEHCCTISDKARAIGGGVLEAIMTDFNNW
jgi:xanthine dehydrogenase accessory factor